MPRHLVLFRHDQNQLVGYNQSIHLNIGLKKSKLNPGNRFVKPCMASSKEVEP